MHLLQSSILPVIKNGLQVKLQLFQKRFAYVIQEWCTCKKSWKEKENSADAIKGSREAPAHRPPPLAIQFQSLSLAFDILVQGGEMPTDMLEQHIGIQSLVLIP
jgi:hypothetical protein